MVRNTRKLRCKPLAAVNFIPKTLKISRKLGYILSVYLRILQNFIKSSEKDVVKLY